MRIEVETRNVDHQVTALGTAKLFTPVVDRPVEAGGGGLGFNGGQLLYLAVAGCISNDLFREARAGGIELSHVRVRVTGEFIGEPAVSNDIQFEVEVGGMLLRIAFGRSWPMSTRLPRSRTRSDGRRASS